MVGPLRSWYPPPRTQWLKNFYTFFSFAQMVLRINIQILFLVFHEVLQIFNHRFFSFLVVQGIHPQPPLSGPTNKKITFLCESNLILKIFSASSHISMVSEAEVFQRLLRGRNLSHPLVVSQPSKPMQHNQSIKP